ncbi:MAG TPA: DUF4199 domain-containing protein [Puia sp.]|jgi:hypothetical protein|nr:DUF4199 domain-containing protein [Puia sp.]
MPAKKISITLLFGLIAALCIIGFVCGTWLAGPEAFIGPTVWLGRCLVILIAAVAATVRKRANGGIIDFRSALRTAYGVMVMAIIAESLCVWLIPNVIDPHFNQRLVPFIMAKAEKWDRQLGASDAIIRADADDIRKNNQFSVGALIMGTGRQLLMFGIIAILIAVTVRSKKGPAPKPES